jgi:hypothetical protein
MYFNEVFATLNAPADVSRGLVIGLWTSLFSGLNVFDCNTEGEELVHVGIVVLHFPIVEYAHLVLTDPSNENIRLLISRLLVRV